jgi:hypothetical protein
MNSSESKAILYKICPNCNGTGQVSNQKASDLQFLSLPCDCKQLRVVPVVPDLDSDSISEFYDEEAIDV